MKSIRRFIVVWPRKSTLWMIIAVLSFFQINAMFYYYDMMKHDKMIELLQLDKRVKDLEKDFTVLRGACEGQNKLSEFKYQEAIKILNLSKSTQLPSNIIGFLLLIP